jgi:hypothetical protein
MPDGWRDEGVLGGEGGVARASFGERSADGPGALHVHDADGSWERAWVGGAIDHVEEARTLFHKPGMIGAEEGAPEKG